MATAGWVGRLVYLKRVGCLKSLRAWSPYESSGAAFLELTWAGFEFTPQRFLVIQRADL